MGHRGYSDDDSIKIFGVIGLIFVGKLEAKSTNFGGYLVIRKCGESSQNNSTPSLRQHFYKTSSELMRVKMVMWWIRCGGS
jgi:hypothetical protein